MESNTPISVYNKVPYELLKVSKVVRMMDSAFRIPGTKIKFGIDPLLNLIPYGGAIVGYGISCYIIITMLRNGASSKVVGKMIGNITLDAVVGTIPILGTIFDFTFKANKRNLILATEHFEQGKHQGSVLPYLIPIMLILIVLFAGITYIAFIILQYFFYLLNTFIV